MYLHSGKFLLFLYLAIVHTTIAIGITKEEFEKFKRQDIQGFLETGESIYQRRIGPPINKKYFRGSNLIYDCEKRHFACVIEDNFKESETLQVEDRRNRVPQFTCVPLLKFTTQKECFEKQMRAVETVVNRGFCLPKYEKIKN
jgi:hypothetical protein